jgi:hypothetical protein
VAATAMHTALSATFVALPATHMNRPCTADSKIGTRQKGWGAAVRESLSKSVRQCAAQITSHIMCTSPEPPTVTHPHGMGQLPEWCAKPSRRIHVAGSPAPGQACSSRKQRKSHWSGVCTSLPPARPQQGHGWSELTCTVQVCPTVVVAQLAGHEPPGPGEKGGRPPQTAQRSTAQGSTSHGQCLAGQPTPLALMLFPKA